MIRVVLASRWILLVLVPFVKHGVCVRNPGIDRPCHFETLMRPSSREQILASVFL